MSDIVWGWPIVLYLWLAGIAGGAYITAVGFNVLNGGHHRTLVRMATYISIPLFGVGMLALVVDLGRPDRVWHMFVAYQPRSVMWFGTYFLVTGSAVGAGLALCELGEVTRVHIPWADRVEYWATRIGWLFALIVVAYVGVVFTQTARPMWSATLLLPALFISSAMSTGAAMLALALQLVKSDEPAWVTVKLKEASVTFIAIEIVILFAFVAWLAQAGAGAQVLFTGVLSLYFWVGLVLLGLLVPLILEWRAPSKGKFRLVLLAAPVLTLLGGLVLRYLITWGAQI